MWDLVILGVVVCIVLVCSGVFLEGGGRSGLQLSLWGVRLRDIYECVLLRGFALCLCLAELDIDE